MLGRYKTKEKRDEEIKNYRPVSGLSSVSKINEKFIQESVTSFVDTFLSEFISTNKNHLAQIMFF